MKKIIFIVLIIIGLVSKSYSQKNSNQIVLSKDESIYKILKKINQKSKSEEIKVLKSLDSIKPSIENQANDSIFGFFYFIKSSIKSNQLDQIEALKYIDLSISYYKKAKNAKGISKSSIEKGNLYARKGDPKIAMQIYTNSLEFAKKNKLDFEYAVLLKNIGLIFFNQDKTKEALSYNQKALEIFIKLKNNKFIAETYTNIGNCYYNNYDSKNALINYKTATNIAVILKDTATLSKLYNNIGAVYVDDEKDTIKGLEYLKLALDLKTKSNNKNDLIFSYVNISNVYVGQKKYDLAENYLSKAYEMASKSKNKVELAEIYDLYSQIYDKKSDFKKSLFYYRQFSKTKDSILNIENLKAVQEINTKYKTVEKQKLILKNEAEAKQKNTTILILSIIAIGLAAIGFLIYRQQKLKNSQQEQEFKLKTAISKIENQNKLQEQRLSISRDLHDNIGSQLTFIISSVDNVKYAFDLKNPKLDDKLTNISSFAQDTIVELRDTIWAMNSNEISFEDLKIRVLNFIEKAKTVKENIDFQFSIDKNLSTQKLTSIEGMNLYRTIQEAVNNAIKYANASKILIAVEQMETEIQITIQDNGIGFDAKTVQLGNGLQNMQKRIKDIGGKFHFTSKIKEGTSIFVFLNN